jgi:diaminohydroxyphosphoribosylaminopyrimidine deaminase/5-amino-6-(5-phosphoribosylamino)uracil reductase
VIGQGWHRRAGQPHAEIEALRDAQRHGHRTQGATLYVTLEPCCTHGRTPPCTDAIVAAGIQRVVAAATDPNPAHAGRGFQILKRAGLAVVRGLLAEEASQLNEAFNHWIVHRTPWVTVKAAMTLDGKIATADGESKWITGEKARAFAMRLRRQADAILVGIHTVLADDPSLTVRPLGGPRCQGQGPRLRRIVLDAEARTPLNARLVRDANAGLTTIVVGAAAPRARVAALGKKVCVLTAPSRSGRIDLRWLLRRLGAENVTSLLVEGGGEVQASFLARRLAHRVVFFYAPKILGGRTARKAVAGESSLHPPLPLTAVQWRRLGPDWCLSARVA